MNLIDSHAHLDMEEFDPDRDDVVRRAFDAGVGTILCPLDVSSERSIAITLDLAAKYPTICAAAGLHPHQAKTLHERLLSKIQELAAAKKILAIGEIGLDFHYNFSTPDEQRMAFRRQLSLAQELGLPAIIHSRDAGREIRAAVEEERFKQGGVLHSFTEDWDFAQGMLDQNFLISFSGIITFPSAHPLREIAKKLPLDKILVETDAPYLTPVPFRNAKKRNEPALVAETAKLLAGLKNIPLEGFAEAVQKNFSSLFPSCFRVV